MTDGITENSSSRSHRRAPKTGFAAWEPWQRLLLFTGSALLALVLVGVMADLALSAGKVHPGITVAGVAIGGMNREAAAATLEKRLPAKANAPVTIVYRDKSWTVNPADLSVTFAYADLVDSAMAIGRNESFGTSALQRMAAWTGKAHLPAPVVADQSKLAALLDKVGSDVDVAPRDAHVSIKGTAVSVEPSADGVAANRPQLSAALLAAFTASSRRVPVQTVTASVKITDQAAQVAKGVAETMLAKPATVTLEQKSWTLAATDLAKLIAFRAVETTAAGSPETVNAEKWILEPYISSSEASKTLPAKLGTGVGRKAVDATFKTSNGKVTIVPSQDGIGPDYDLLAEDMTRVLVRDPAQDRVVVLTTRTTQPKRTTAMARDMGIVERISTYTTTYGAGNKSRVNNIHTLGDALDGKLVSPGSTFSFNGYIGERTAAKGYQEANAIVNGKLVPQLGGGICQVGTTLFNAIFLSGFPVKERHNHSFYISHYPKGRDATVSWGGPDLKFVNDTENWVMVSVSYSSSSITISLYGTDPGYDVTSKTGPFTSDKPFATETIKDPKLAAGLKVVEDGGITGRTCVVTRTVSKGGSVVRTDQFKSVYRPKIEVVRMGTKAPGKATSGTSGGN